jgi:hypothetical protein
MGQVKGSARIQWNEQRSKITVALKGLLQWPDSHNIAPQSHRLIVELRVPVKQTQYLWRTASSPELHGGPCLLARSYNHCP